MQVKYLSKIHTRWISNHCAISLSVPSIFNKLRVPNTEVFIWFFPLWKNSDSWPQIPTICRVLQMCLQSLKHLSRGSHVTSIKNLMRKNKLFLTVVQKTKLAYSKAVPEDCSIVFFQCISGHFSMRFWWQKWVPSPSSHSFQSLQWTLSPPPACSDNHHYWNWKKIVKICFLHSIYALFTKREVKMAGY